MPFTPRTAATIRQALLSDWRARYLALTPPQDLSIEEGDDAYNQADSWAKSLEPTEYLAGQAAARVLVRGQFGTELDQTAEDDGTWRKPATAARLTVPVTGPVAGGTTLINGASLSSSGGLRFVPIDPVTGVVLSVVTVDGSAHATLTVECTTLGVDGNLPSGTVLTWSTAPTGFASTATSSGITRQGTAVESDTQLQARLVERRRERPASGNRADWRAWALSVAGVGDVFVHCAALKPDATAAPARATITPDSLGCVTLLPLNPAPEADSYVQNADGTLGLGLSPAYSRVPSDALCAQVEGYIDGTLDTNGVEVAEAEQMELYPAVIRRESWGAVPVLEGPVDVTVGIKVYPDVWVFASARTVQPGASTTVIELNNGFGLVTGTAIAVELPAGHIRGDFFLTKVANLSSNTITVDPPLPVAPVSGAEVRHDPGAWSDVRAAVLQYFDSLGPGTTSGRSQRFPPTTWGASDRFSPSQLLARVISAPSLTDATTYLPAAASTSALGFLATPGKITIQRYT